MAALARQGHHDASAVAAQRARAAAKDEALRAAEEACSVRPAPPSRHAPPPCSHFWTGWRVVHSWTRVVAAIIMPQFEPVAKGTLRASRSPINVIFNRSVIPMSPSNNRWPRHLACLHIAVTATSCRFGSVHPTSAAAHSKFQSSAVPAGEAGGAGAGPAAQPVLAAAGRLRGRPRRRPPLPRVRGRRVLPVRPARPVLTCMHASPQFHLSPD